MGNRLRFARQEVVSDVRASTERREEGVPLRCAPRMGIQLSNPLPLAAQRSLYSPYSVPVSDSPTTSRSPYSTTHSRRPEQYPATRAWALRNESSSLDS